MTPYTSSGIVKVTPHQLPIRPDTLGLHPNSLFVFASVSLSRSNIYVDLTLGGCSISLNQIYLLGPNSPANFKLTPHVRPSLALGIS